MNSVAPKIAAPQAKAAQASASALASRRSAFVEHGANAVKQTSPAQGAIGSRPVSYLAKRRNFGPRENGRSSREQDRVEDEPIGETAPRDLSYNFSDIPLFPPDRSNGTGETSQPDVPLFVQPKLEIGAVDDPLEREADHVAEQVMRMPNPQASLTSASIRVSRKCAACKEEDKQKLQMKRATAGGAKSAETAANVREVTRAAGHSFPSQSRDFFEVRFRRDFGEVRIHTDWNAGRSAQSVGALAYTVGNHIVFAPGQYAPDTCAGRRLLAHELAHVLQQSSTASNIGQTSASPTAAGIAVPTRATPRLQRACLPATECASPTSGEPAKMRDEGEKEKEASEKANANKPGNGRPAVRLKQFAQVSGVSLTKVADVVVDLNAPSVWGAYTAGCTSIPGVTITNQPNAWCTYVHEADELGAGQFLDNPGLGTINGMPRELWRLRAIQRLTHEQQHAIFGQATHTSAPGGCPREMVIPGTKQTVNSYLSELGSIISEFPSEFRALESNPRTGSIWRNTKLGFFDYKVLNSTESISGILHALRCSCSCDAVEFFVRDTFLFATRGWSRDDRVLFNAIMKLDSYKQLNWPLTGDPVCVERCEQRFQECLKGGGADTGLSADPGLTCLANRSACFQSCP